VVTLGVGAVLMGGAASLSSEADRMPLVTKQDGLAYDAKMNDAESRWRQGAVVTGIGLAAAGAAVWMWVARPAPEVGPAVVLRPWLGRDGEAGLALGGRW
jgi:hypothetical protein